MSIKLLLDEMTVQEKLAAMESLWEDLSRSPEAIESPAVSPAEEAKQTTAIAPTVPAAVPQSAAQQSTPPQSPAGAATTAPPGQVELNIPPPPLPETAPPELSQSAFSSSPLP